MKKTIIALSALAILIGCSKEDHKPVYPTPPAKPRTERVDTTVRTKSPSDTTKPKKGINIVHNN